MTNLYTIQLILFMDQARDCAETSTASRAQLQVRTSDVSSNI